MISGIGSFLDYSQMSSMRSRMENPFEKLDSNGDGSLDKTEISSMAEKLSEMRGESVDAGQIISKLDSDGDGLVNEEEFEAGRPEGPPPGMMGGGMPGSAAQSLLDEFEEMDSDGDGLLDETEFGSMAEMLSGMTGKSIDAGRIISKLDTDGDGRVSREEFEAGRPEGPPPGMMGGGMRGNPTQSLLDEMDDSEDDDSSDLVSFLDTNGDGIVDAEEAKSGINRLILEYGSLIAGTSKQVGGNESQVNLFV